MSGAGTDSGRATRILSRCGLRTTTTEGLNLPELAGGLVADRVLDEVAGHAAVQAHGHWLGSCEDPIPDRGIGSNHCGKPGSRGRPIQTAEIDDAEAKKLRWLQHHWASGERRGLLSSIGLRPAHVRDLHAEAIDYFVDSIQPPSARVAVRVALAWKRSLDRGNPTPDNIAADFNRFGMTFWPEVYAVDLGGAKREIALKELNKWRNAIAHHDFDASKLAGRTTVTLQMVQRWRSACNGLARSFDGVVSARITQLTGAKTW